ncbi:MAG TPA: SGNH/GDSL hydrolase family protein [Oscillatoriaceae cyanobacterium]
MRDRRRLLAATLVLLALGCSVPAAPLVLHGDAPQSIQSSAGPGLWIALGDSITVDAFATPTTWNQVLSADAPQVLNAGVWGETSAQGLARLPALLAAHPDARAVGIGFGSNDAFDGVVSVSDFTANLRAMVAQIRAAGMRTAIASIPYSPKPDVAAIPQYNAAIAALDQELGLTPGPDLYTWFKAHPDELQADGVHPDDAGDASIQRLWADIAQELL